MTLIEAKQRLGGRAASFFDTRSQTWIDTCQHIGLGCCTEWLDFCEHLGLTHLLQRSADIYFLEPGGVRHRFAAYGWLPPPYHLLPAFAAMRFLSWSERLKLAAVVQRLARGAWSDDPAEPTVAEWLTQQRVSERCVRRFFEPVLVSALGDKLNRASLPMAQKVFLDGFLRTIDGFHLVTPTCPLVELYDQHAASALRQLGVDVRRNCRIKQLLVEGGAVRGVEFANRRSLECDVVVVATAWRQLPALVPEAQRSSLQSSGAIGQIAPSPITGVHLWLDRPILDLPQAAILDRLSDWIFAKHPSTLANAGLPENFYTVVISASQHLRGRTEASILEEVMSDLGSVLPDAAEAQLKHGRVTTERHAVFSVRPGLSQYRPSAETEIRGLYLAGDWTNTGWPATMEGAVRSGRAAAMCIAS